MDAMQVYNDNVGHTHEAAVAAVAKAAYDEGYQAGYTAATPTHEVTEQELAQFDKQQAQDMAQVTDTEKL